MSRYDGPLLFADIEATGLDPWEPGASILELGFVITEGRQLEVKAKANLLIKPPGSLNELDLLWSKMAPEVKEMHTANGLWDAATRSGDAWKIWEADKAMVQWLNEQGITEPIPLAGSGVERYDRPWINVHMPLLASRLVYWALDIAPMRRTLQYAGRDDLVDIVSDVDAKPHRALADAELHVTELKRYLDLLESVPRVGALT